MENSLFQQAKSKMMNMMNMKTPVEDTDRQAVSQAIQAAVEQATPEERQELQQLEQQLRANNQL